MRSITSIFMDDDQHWQVVSPVRSQRRTGSRRCWRTRAARSPAAKLIIALGNYGYDWHDGIADALTVNEAWLASA